MKHLDFDGLQHLMSKLNSKFLTDSPKNGQTYGRKNGAWVAVEGGGSGGGDGEAGLIKLWDEDIDYILEPNSYIVYNPQGNVPDAYNAIYDTVSDVYETAVKLDVAFWGEFNDGVSDMGAFAQYFSCVDVLGSIAQDFSRIGVYLTVEEPLTSEEIAHVESNGYIVFDGQRYGFLSSWRSVEGTIYNYADFDYMSFENILIKPLVGFDSLAVIAVSEEMLGTRLPEDIHYPDLYLHIDELGFMTGGRASMKSSDLSVLMNNSGLGELIPCFARTDIYGIEYYVFAMILFDDANGYDLLLDEYGEATFSLGFMSGVNHIGLG